MRNLGLFVLVSLLAVPAVAKNILTDLYWTAEGAHSPAPYCAAGYQVLGGAADCGGGKCYGNQLLCGRVVAHEHVAFNEGIVTDFWMTPEGSHLVGGGACPAGYQVRGSIADCGGAYCQGNQRLCVRTVPEYLALPWEQVVTHLWMTPSGSHAVGAGCPAGYAAKAGFADCGHAVCYGNQLVCAVSGPLY